MSASEFDELVRRLDGIEQQLGNSRDWLEAQYKQTQNLSGERLDRARTLIDYEFTVGYRMFHLVGIAGHRLHMRAPEGAAYVDPVWEVACFNNTDCKVIYLDQQIYTDHAAAPS